MAKIVIPLVLASVLAFQTVYSAKLSQDERPSAPQASNKTNDAPLLRVVGAECISIRDCATGLICVSGNPRGSCQTPQGILGFAHLLVNLIQEDYTPSAGNNVDPEQQGPTGTSRALAMVFLAVHDAYGVLTGSFTPKITSGFLPIITANVPTGTSEQAEFAALAAGLTTAKEMYPRSSGIIDQVRAEMLSGSEAPFTSFGDLVGQTWVQARQNDGASIEQLDDAFINAPFHHQPDPNYNIVTGNSGSQQNFGRYWGLVASFVVPNIPQDIILGPNPNPSDQAYIESLREVEEKGQCNELTLPDGHPMRDIGVFWGYDGMPKIGVPPRLYLQVVLAVQELETLSFANQVRAFAAVNVAMADAGIAAWFWKFVYDLFRPVIGVRDYPEGDPTWNPIGVAFSNISPQSVPACVGLNPNFPAYPSGHASFGSAAFRTISALLGKDPSDISVTITSDELNGRTIDGVTGSQRRVFTQSISLQEAIEQNNEARVLLGVHWKYDSDGGDSVGGQVAAIVADAFRFI